MTVSMTLQRRLTFVVLWTVTFALGLSAAALLAYEVFNYRKGAVSELSIQADLLAYTSETALAFDDAKAAEQSLALLRLQPQIRTAIVYRADGSIFAAFSAGGDAAVAGAAPVSPSASASAPEAARAWSGHRFSGNLLELSRAIDHNGETVGRLFLQARYELGARIGGYVMILAGTMLGSLLLAGLVFSPLQRKLMEPVHALSAAAKDVVDRGEYRVQVLKTSNDELGVMVDAFNRMLGEVARRTDDLEDANRKLSLQIEQTQQAQELLRQADRRKDDFLATLAHELRNPMAPIVNAIAVLKLKDPQDPQLRWVRDVIDRQVRHMARLVDDLLDVARITRGKIELRLDSVDLAVAVRTALESTQPAVDKLGHQVSVSLPPAPVPVVGDMTRLAQIVTNLINNAAKYTPPPGRIEVELAQEGDEAVVRVRDSGVGIAAEHLGAVFEMFTQLESPLSRNAGGLGIGLALAKALVGLHGGTLGVSSGGVGQGSCFTLRLPLDRRVASAAEPVAESTAAPTAATTSPTQLAARAAAPEATSAPAPTGCRVMVVDDNRDAALSLAAMLKLQGFEVCEAHDGAEALSRGAAMQPEVVLMDIGMPRMNGYEAASRIRQAPWGRHSLLVAITGWGQDQDRERAREAGFDHHLTKPVDPARLDALIRSHNGDRHGAASQNSATRDAA